MDTPSIVAVVGLGVVGIGGIWTFGVFVGGLRKAIESLTETIFELRAELATLRDNHASLRQEVAVIKGVCRSNHERPPKRGAD